MKPRITNAYMLAYIRESDIEEILAPIKDSDIPKHLSERIKKEELEKKKAEQEKKEQHRYVIISVNISFSILFKIFIFFKNKLSINYK